MHGRFQLHWCETNADSRLVLVVYAMQLAMQVPLEHKFASEAPGRPGLHQKALLQFNLQPEVIFDDLLARGLLLPTARFCACFQ